MTLTEIERTIIAVNIIGVILEEYEEHEVSKAIPNAQREMQKFLTQAKRNGGADSPK